MSEDVSQAFDAESRSSSAAIADPIDLALIRELQANGRATYAELAAAAGVTEKTAHRRVGRLIADEVVRIAAVTDPAVLGYTAAALLGIRLTPGSRAADLVERLKSLERVDYIVTTSGRFPVQVEVVCRDESELAALVDDTIRVMPGVRDIDLLPYLRLHYQQARFHAGELTRLSGVRPRALDDLDRNIVEQFALNGRAAFVEVAARIGVSQVKLRQRFQRLIDSNTMKVMAIVNPLQLGLSAVAWVEIKVDQGHRVEEIAETLTTQPSVSYLALTFGRCDILVEVVCADKEELNVLLNERLRFVPGVGEFTVSQYFDLVYKPLLPPQPATPVTR
ncbi:Lrp/AsnC family transcriptional regulator [Ruicaihuangia caeni]|uniref:Lrp/AsnC family transcriptional regulator n=1 Tax=Ruicaihuangia caeni TaxID=3042517 RepID=A0AAW6T509_9MICO|nr:Lrp/AsnC family transcriptional regulator [Klugiella sp. YN-L-19]MDI2098916.1 Lrp/AsnC family transcriptional regulator [Klugiella sp. YN-L-19]